MSLAAGGIGGAAGGLTSLSHTAGFNQLHPTIGVDDVPDFDEIDATPIPQNDLTTDAYEATNKHGAPIHNYPHISIDLFGDTKDVVYHVPLVIPIEEQVNRIVCLGQHIDGNVCIKRTEQSYKILKKFLRSDCSGELYQQVLDHCLVSTPKEGGIEDVCVITEPHLLLGARRMELVNDITLKKYSVVKSTSSTTATSSDVANAIEPLLDDNEKENKTHVWIRNQTVDGSNNIQQNDYDRVAFQIHVLDNKKPFFILPEEIVSLQLAQVRKIVQDDMTIRFSYEEEKDISFLDYPIGLPVPSWALTDALSEAVLDACNVLQSSEYTLTYKELHHHRCLCAINGEVVRLLNGSISGGKEGSKLFTTIRKFFPKQEQKFGGKEKPDEEMQSQDTLPVIHSLGITSNGIEGVAFQITEDVSHIKCLSETGYQSDDPYNYVEKVLKDLRSGVSKSIPKKYRKPAAIVTYGSLSTQIKLHAQLKELIAGESSFSSWKKTALISTKEETTSFGACVLAAEEDFSMAHVCDNIIDIQPVSNTSVGVRITTNSKDTDTDNKAIKIIFDFDRRVPAGPYKLLLSAAEIVAREIIESATDEELTEKQINKYSGAKYIPQREKAAKKLRVQIYQKVERGGIWIPVGDAVTPLLKKEKKEGSEEDEIIACESSTLQLSLSDNGVLTASIVGNLESVAQALENSRYLTIRYYGILTTVVTLCIYFFIRSYWEEYTNKRDMKRLLHYYKLVAPGSFHDGDNWNARYLVWKYGKRRHVLWRRLEAKYQTPVPEIWDDFDVVVDDEDDIDFDDMEEEEQRRKKEREEKNEKDEF